MKNFVSTVIGGMIGLAALYVVGRIAYQAGHDMGEMEERYRAMSEKTEAAKASAPAQESHSEEAQTQEENALAAIAKPAKRVGLLQSVRQIFGRKKNVIGNLICHPEAHSIEAYIQGEELKVSVRPRAA